MEAVTVKYLGSFPLVTGKIREEIEISDGESICSLLAILKRKYGKKFEDSWDNPLTRLWINGTMTYERERILRNGDKLIFGTLVGGG